MAATVLWFVPGFCGSSLAEINSQTGRPRRLLWGGVQNIAWGVATRLLTWEAPEEPEIRVGRVIRLQAYGGFLDWLATAKPADWTVQEYPFDFRAPLTELGRALAEDIRGLNPQPAGGHRILAHSQGGLVARLAWARLKELGLQSLVKRIVTVGTPHFGGYAGADIMRESDQALTWLVALAGLAFLPGAGGWRNSAPYRAALARMAMSWPGVYDMFPDPSKADDPDDINRGEIYEALQWQASVAPPDQAELDRVKNVFWPYVRNPTNTPPRSVLTCVVGSSRATPWRLRSRPMTVFNFPRDPLAQRRIQMPSLQGTDLGDNRFTVASQREPGYQTYLINHDHSAELDNDRLRFWLIAILQETIADPLPTVQPAPPETIPTTESPAFLFQAESALPPNPAPPASARPVNVGSDVGRSQLSSLVRVPRDARTGGRNVRGQSGRLSGQERRPVRREPRQG